MSNVNVNRNYIVKQAYAYKWDNVSLEDIVTSGYDVNNVEDEQLERAVWQEGINVLKDMYEHTDFSKEAWTDKLSSLLKKAGMEDPKRASKVVSRSVTNIFEYLDSLGWS